LKKIALVLTISFFIYTCYGQNKIIADSITCKQSFKLAIPIHRILYDLNDYFIFRPCLKVSYEYRLSKVICPNIQVGLLFPNNLLLNVGTTFYVGNKIYLNKKKDVNGIYISPEFIYNNTKTLFNFRYDEYKCNEMGWACLIGFQKIFLHKIKSEYFTIDTFGGLGKSTFITYSKSTQSPKDISFATKYWKPYFGIQLGVSF
jgi:hypothetical protein